VKLSDGLLEKIATLDWTLRDKPLDKSTLERALELGWEYSPKAKEFCDFFGESEIDGCILFGTAGDDKRLCKIVQDWSQKKNIKLFPVGWYDSYFLMSEDGAIFETDTDIKSIWKWGNTPEEGLENMLFTREWIEKTQISDGFGNIVDF
jgi:SUKH-3 immunity protein